MTAWRVQWCGNLRNEHQDHDTEAKAQAHEAALRRKGVSRVAVFAVVIMP